MLFNRYRWSGIIHIGRNRYSKQGEWWNQVPRWRWILNLNIKDLIDLCVIAGGRTYGKRILCCFIAKKVHNPLLWNQGLFRDDSRIAPSQWETALLCNDVSHWLDARLESALLFSSAITYLCEGPIACCWMWLWPTCWISRMLQDRTTDRGMEIFWKFLS